MKKLGFAEAETQFPVLRTMEKAGNFRTAFLRESRFCQNSGRISARFFAERNWKRRLQFHRETGKICIKISS
jgi:hypothetical protein